MASAGLARFLDIENEMIRSTKEFYLKGGRLLGFGAMILSGMWTNA